MAWGRSRRSKILLGALALVVLVAALTAMVALPAVHDLQAARGALEGSAADLESEDVSSALDYLERVDHRLSGVSAHVLGFVPVVGPSLNAMRAVAASARPVLTTGLTLKQRLDELRKEGLLDHGRIRLDAIATLRDPVESEISALGALEGRVEDHRTGWVAPPVWDALDEISRRIDSLREDAGAFRGFLDVVDGLLGADGPRTYLVMLVNNAELRGAGGVLSGLGTMTIRNGKIGLGAFYPYEVLVRHPYKAVPAPADYERRYARYGANTTVFVNATYSPDVPDDAIVASRLFKLVQGTATDGAFVVDPRGLAALLPDDDRIPVPATDIDLAPDDLPRFIYSDAYDVFDDNTERRAAILQVGRRAFEDVVESGSADEATTDAAAAAFAAGHLRFVSFDDAEGAALDALGASGNLEPVDGDRLLVAVQNFGGGHGQGTKLDYWVKRLVEHRCNVDDDASAICSTAVTLTNDAPDGLSRYEAGRPYGLLRSYVETFVPAAAELDAVTVDGEASDFYPQEEEGAESVAVPVKVPQGEQATIEVRYRLPAGDDGYSFVADPQALARDAHLRVAIAFPSDWSVDAPGDVEDGVLDYDGAFVSTYEVRAQPDRRTGIPGVWDSLADFWREPL